MVALDEGFDRPVWKVIQSAFGALPNRLVPRRIETILEDGILFALSQNKKLPKSESWKSSRKAWDRQTLNESDTRTYGSFILSELSTEIRRGLEITILIKSGSTLSKNASVEAIARAGVRVFSEPQI